MRILPSLNHALDSWKYEQKEMHIGGEEKGELQEYDMNILQLAWFDQ